MPLLAAALSHLNADPTTQLPADALEKLRANDESYTKCDLSYSSLFSSRADELAAEIAEVRDDPLM